MNDQHTQHTFVHLVTKYFFLKSWDISTLSWAYERFLLCRDKQKMLRLQPSNNYVMQLTRYVGCHVIGIKGWKFYTLDLSWHLIHYRRLKISPNCIHTPSELLLICLVPFMSYFSHNKVISTINLNFSLTIQCMLWFRLRSLTEMGESS